MRKDVFFWLLITLFAINQTARNGPISDYPEETEVLAQPECDVPR